MQGGIFGHDGFEEVIAVTYSGTYIANMTLTIYDYEQSSFALYGSWVQHYLCTGWVFGLTTETTDKKIRVDDGNFSISEDTRQKLIRLK